MGGGGETFEQSVRRLSGSRWIMGPGFGEEKRGEKAEARLTHPPFHLGESETMSMDKAQRNAKKNTHLISSTY